MRLICGKDWMMLVWSSQYLIMHCIMNVGHISVEAFTTYEVKVKKLFTFVCICEVCFENPS